MTEKEDSKEPIVPLPIKVISMLGASVLTVTLFVLIVVGFIWAVKLLHWTVHQ